MKTSDAFWQFLPEGLDELFEMVKEKTGRAMQEKERERKGKNGKIIKVAGCSPIREGVLLIKPDTTLEEVRKFGEMCRQRWGITPLQIFLHKDEGHWLNGQPDAADKESFQVGDRWFKPNYHAHIVFDWMNHDTGKSQKLNDEDMTEMQKLGIRHSPDGTWTVESCYRQGAFGTKRFHY